MSALEVAGGHDAVLLDLDGVVYTGRAAVPGAAEALGRWHAAGLPYCFVTNNAAYPAARVAERLRGFGVELADADVMTSGQAAAAELAAQLDPGTPVLVVGSPALRELVAAAGLAVRTPPAGDEAPPHVAAVVHGFDRDIGWHGLTAAIRAIRGGARSWATNPDPSVPTEDGELPGNGTFVDIVARFSGVEPTVIGKPAATMLIRAAQRLGARSPLMVGDRLSTDMAAARAAGFACALVLTGIDDVHAALTALPEARPDTVVADLAQLAQALPEARVDGDGAVCGDGRAQLSGGRLRLAGPPRPAVQAALALTAGMDPAGLDLAEVPRRFDA